MNSDTDMDYRLWTKSTSKGNKVTRTKDAQVRTIKGQDRQGDTGDAHEERNMSRDESKAGAHFKNKTRKLQT